MRKLIIVALGAGSLSLVACASNYAGEGALAGGVVGGVIGAQGGDAAEGAAIGAAAGAAGGALIKKKHRHGCYRYDRNGHRYWDRNC